MPKVDSEKKQADVKEFERRFKSAGWTVERSTKKSVLVSKSMPGLSTDQAKKKKSAS